MLPPSGMPPEITDAWTTPGAWLMRSTICVNAGALSGGGLPGSESRRDLHGQHVVRIEPGIDAHQRDEAADEERRADEQHHRERDLGDDEHAAHALPAGAGARAARAVLQRLREIGPRQLQRRDDAEEQAGDERQAGGGGEHAQVERDRR